MKEDLLDQRALSFVINLLIIEIWVARMRTSIRGEQYLSREIMRSELTRAQHYLYLYVYTVNIVSQCFITRQLGI